MSKVKFKVDQAGVKELLRSGDVQDLVRSAGEKVANAAGDGFTSEMEVQKRAVAFVKPDSPKAYYSNRKNHTLEKVLGGLGK